MPFSDIKMEKQNLMDYEVCYSQFGQFFLFFNYKFLFFLTKTNKKNLPFQCYGTRECSNHTCFVLWSNTCSDLGHGYAHKSGLNRIDKSGLNSIDKSGLNRIDKSGLNRIDKSGLNRIDTIDEYKKSYETFNALVSA